MNIANENLYFSSAKRLEGSSHSADAGESSDGDDLDGLYSPNTRRKLYRKSRTKGGRSLADHQKLDQGTVHLQR